MIKKPFILLISLLCCFAAQAQVSFGVRGGINLSSVTNTSSFFTEFSYQPGLVLGGVADIPLSANLHIRPEILFSTKGSKETQFGGSSFDNMEAVDYQETIHYLEIPVYLAYHGELGAGELITNIGPYLGIALAGSYEGGTYKPDDGSFGFINKASMAEADEILKERAKLRKRTDYGLAAGLGYKIGRFMFNGTYSFSLPSMYTKIDDEQMEEPIWLNERRYKVFHFSVAYFLRSGAE